MLFEYVEWVCLPCLKAFVLAKHTLASLVATRSAEVSTPKPKAKATAKAENAKRPAATPTTAPTKNPRGDDHFEDSDVDCDSPKDARHNATVLANAKSTVMLHSTSDSRLGSTIWRHLL